MPEAVALVIPCFNEAVRLQREELLRLARAREGLSLVLVDDGSTDGTVAVLDELRRAEPARISVVLLPRNRGKAEAVREGLRRALAGGAAVVGYADADLSTPVDELVRLVDTARGSRREAVLGSRVRLLGRRIERQPLRHYLGRVFATLASLALGLAVYDTQCGAKLFRATPALAAALEAPFRTRWIFDVELLARLRAGGPGVAPLGEDAFEEVPLLAWRDVGGSKLRPGAMLAAGLQLVALGVRLRLGRR
ncbi:MULTISPECIES: glycosyltransferase [unclassified Anaeromyxobacter]|uniref:glycosyltransferase n=1 Tax=unclassified Anaeromyxobacter TaxID=2620896 RepID=UPI001F5A6A77|nr:MULTISPECIES: glycosyltransferase [unclassified Anaeromyxobacter]